MDTRSGQGDASNGSTATESATGAFAREHPLGANHDPSRTPPGVATAEETAPGVAGAGPAAAERLVDDFQELTSAARLLLTARYDQIRLTLRRALLIGVLAGVAGCALAALAASACVMLVVGIAGALSQWTGTEPWVGQLLTGAGLVGGAALAGFVLLRIWQRSSLRKTLKRYGKLDR